MGYLVSKYKDFSTQKINRLIKKSVFFKGPASMDAPAKIPEHLRRLCGHAVQNWVLIRHLPLLLEDFVTDKDDPIWKMLLDMVKITEIVCSQVFRSLCW